MPLFDLELELILWLRAGVPGLVGVFEALTFLGNEMFFLAFLPLVYWCFDRATGARLTVLFLLSAFTNAVAKIAVNMPRPFDYAPERVEHLFPMGIEAAAERYEAGGNGFPSGHTQNSVAIWGYLISVLTHCTKRDSVPSERSQPHATWRTLRPLLLVLFALLILLVPLSRLYLAVHFPRDIVGGYVIGAALLALFLWLTPKAEAELARRPFATQLGLAVAVPLLMVAILPSESGVTPAATLLGMGVGFVLERHWIHFESSGALWRRALRYALGILVMLALYAGLKAAFAALNPGPQVALGLRFVRYALIGLWGSAGAPWVFTRIGLAERAKTIVS